MHLTIGITGTASHYENYPPWIMGEGQDIEIIRLMPGHADELGKCDGIVLGGGVDTHPKFYNSDNLNYPNAPEKFDEQRDIFELEIFAYAQKKNLPVLAICRGMQLVNIALGGDMIQDIEASGKEDHRRDGSKDRMHEVVVAKDSLLYEITGRERGIVNSAHHQAAGVIAPALMVNAYAPDGIAEGAEWKDKTGKPFLLCVQWHPERLAQLQPDHPFAGNIRKKFLARIMAGKSV